MPPCCQWLEVGLVGTKSLINKYKVKKETQSLKSQKKWRAKKAKSKSISKSKSSTMDCHHEALELFQTTKPMGLRKGQILTIYGFFNSCLNF